MTRTGQLRRYAGRRLTRRLTRSLPWVGGAVALLTLGSAMRRKGVLGGAVHTALDFIPFVGGFKNVAEVARGRDFVPDKRPATVSAAAQPASPPFKTNGGTRS